MTVDQSDIGVLSGDRLSVKVDPDAVGITKDNRGLMDEVEDHSFKTIGTSPDRDKATVTLGAGLTRLRLNVREPIDVVFDGFRYFPTDYKGDDRGPLDADVDFESDDGSEYWPARIHDTHLARDMNVRQLISGLGNGTVEVLPKKD